MKCFQPMSRDAFFFYLLALYPPGWPRASTNIKPKYLVQKNKLIQIQVLTYKMHPPPQPFYCIGKKECFVNIFHRGYCKSSLKFSEPGLFSYDVTYHIPITPAAIQHMYVINNNTPTRARQESD